MRWILDWAAVWLGAALCGCYQPPPPRPPSRVFPVEKDYARPLPVGAHALRRVNDLRRSPDYERGLGASDLLRIGVEHSLRWLDAPSSARSFPFERIDGPPLTREHVRASLVRFREILMDPALDVGGRAAAIQRDFEVYESVGWDGSGAVLFTAYCEYTCRGSLMPSGKYAYPLYRRPEDLSEVVAREGRYLDRRAIDEGRALQGRQLEIAYVSSPLDAYLIQVQGSGQVILEEGGILRVGWAGDNGHPYQSIGTRLIDEGKLDPNRYSLEEMRRYFSNHPAELPSILYTNPRYVFFRETTGEGPYGSLGVPVTPRVSIATDKRVFPPGSLCFLETTLPTRGRSGEFVDRPLHTFAFDQDTGGAIQSAGRCDLFLGRGARAQRVAGHTHQEGQLYYLFLKGR